MIRLQIEYPSSGFCKRESLFRQVSKHAQHPKNQMFFENIVQHPQAFQMSAHFHPKRCEGIFSSRGYFQGTSWKRVSRFYLRITWNSIYIVSKSYIEFQVQVQKSSYIKNTRNIYILKIVILWNCELEWTFWELRITGYENRQVGFIFHYTSRPGSRNSEILIV